MWVLRKESNNSFSFSFSKSLIKYLSEGIWLEDIENLEKKKEYLSKITGFKEITICEDYTEHYEYWKNNFNPNPDDCCNLNFFQRTWQIFVSCVIIF